MKLYEIFRVDKIDPKDASYISALGLRPDGKIPHDQFPRVAPVSKVGFEILGSGVEAVVYTTKDDPGVIKLLRNFPDKDVKEQNISYVKYTWEILNLANGNPFFPRISKMKKIKADAADFAALRSVIQFHGRREMPAYDFDVYAFKMERLIPVSHLGEKEMESLISNAFDAEKIDAEYGTEWRTNKRVAIELLDQMMNDMMWNSYGIPEFANNPDLLKEVVEVIRRVIGNGDESSYDMHSENFMARRTQVGYQLVITDPVV